MNNKKIILIIVSIIIIVAIIVLLKVFVFYDKYKMPDGAIIKVDEDTIDVYQEKMLYELFEKYNMSILTSDTFLDTNTTGEHTFTIEYKYGKDIRKYLYDVKYTVVDNVKPKFIYGISNSKTYYIEDNVKIDDVLKKITYGDNYDVTPSLTYETDVDFSKVGNYTLEVILEDSSGNKTTNETTIKVLSRQEEKEKAKEVENEEDDDEEEEDDTILFSDHITTYKNDNTMVGIDVSKWQKTVDFTKIKEAGCEFVIIRMGVMKTKDDSLVIDNTFEENYKNAKEAGLKVGIYIYSEANTVEKAEENAQFVIDNLNGDKLDFPIAFDWESWTYFNSMDMNLHMLNAMYDAFNKKLTDAGYTTMLYGSQNYLKNTWLSVKGYDIWAARYYTVKPSIDDTNLIMWQQANTGSIDGIDGDVDLDIYYKK